MKPLSEAAAKRRAIALGGKLELPAGKVFNAARSTGSIPARPPEKPEPNESTAKALKPDEGALSSAAIEKLASAAFTLVDSNVILVDGINRQLSTVPAPLKSVKSWKFTINRDKVTGLMTSIDAKAVL